MKAVVAAFNQEKALVGAFSVITNLRMEIFEALVDTDTEGGDTAPTSWDRRFSILFLGGRLGSMAAVDSTADDLNVSASKALSKHLFWNIKIQTKC